MTDFEIWLFSFWMSGVCMLPIIALFFSREIANLIGRLINFIARRPLCHVWRYKRHLRRECTICHLHQDTYCYAWDLWKAGKGWWETMCPVPQNPCGLKAKKP